MNEAQSKAGASTPQAQEPERNDRRTAVGVVMSAKMTKTVVVEVESSKRHRRYEKTMRTQSRRYVHDEKGEARVGDQVLIMATRRLSKNKLWRLVSVLRRAQHPVMVDAAVPAMAIASATGSAPAGAAGEAGQNPRAHS